MDRIMDENVHALAKQPTRLFASPPYTEGVCLARAQDRVGADARTGVTPREDATNAARLASYRLRWKDQGTGGGAPVLGVGCVLEPKNAADTQFCRCSREPPISF